MVSVIRNSSEFLELKKDINFFLILKIPKRMFPASVAIYALSSSDI